MPRHKRKRQEVQAQVSQEEEEVVKADSAPVEESQESKKQKTDSPPPQDDEVNLAEGEQEIQNEEQKENFKGAAVDRMGLKV